MNNLELQNFGARLPTSTNFRKQPAAKISIIGAPAVGKSTLVKLLRGKQISGKYNPTMGFNLGAQKLNGQNFKVWDFGGQKAFLKQHLSKYIHGSDIIFVVTDSTPMNVLTTKEILEHTQSLIDDDCVIIGIANKQDISGHMGPGRVEDVLQIPTVGMIAIDPERRDAVVNLVGDLMEKVEARKRA